MKLSRLALAIAVMPGLSLAAEPYVAEPLVVTSGRLAEPQAQATAATTVFKRDDIERLQVSSVTELLERVPGLSVVRTGGAGSQTGVFLRGTSTAQTLVLVDGQRIAAASSGTSSLEFLAPEQIERIEVVRGARSALYGSDAIGGVIQIFTRQGDGQGLKPYARLATGSDSTYQRSLGLSGGDKRTRFHLGATLDETAGIDATRDGFGANGDDDAYRNRSLSLNLSHRFNDNLQVGLSALDQRGQVEYDDVFTGLLPTTDFQVSSLSGFIDGRLNERWSSRLGIGHSKDQRDTGDDSLAAPDYSFFTYTTYRDSASWVNTLTLSDNQQILAGADWYEDRLHSSTAFAEDSRWNRAAFLQHRYTGDTFSTELGLRHDDNQQFGRENTWNAALTLPLNSANDLILSYSEGFRAPTFNDLYDPWAGNPDLQAERSKSYEIQWRSRYSDTGSLQTSVYRTDIEDAIVANEVSFYVPQNVQHARINGFEAAVQQELFGWQGNLALALIDPRDRASGHTLLRRAKRTLSLDLDRRFGDVSLGAGWRAVSGRYDDADNEIEMSGYGLLSFRATWQAMPELGLSLKLDNLLDKDYAEATYSTPNGRFGYNSAGRTALFAVTWTPQL
ncbi:TonB-dependent receptor domain-containing protein [Ectopseudomonas toyotomiensis]|uniref:TonB-dependent receptor domain-containing protein n=1 Tax=Ectopseudomonas toyotomiensis TaxID=554344 RepID=UPI003D10A5B6